MANWIGSRGRTVVRTSAWSLLAKSSAAAVYLISVPLAYSALEPAQFGLWATLVSIVAFSNFMDFGIGNGCMNLIASAHAKGDFGKAAAIFRQGLIVLLFIAATLFCLYLGGLFLLEPGRFTAPNGSALAGSTPIISLAIAVALLSAPLSLGLRARLATGHGDSAFRWQTVGHAGALLALYLASSRHPTLLSLTAAAMLPPLLAAAINALIVSAKPEFRCPSPMDRPERWLLRRSIAREGSLFFVLQLSAAAAFSADLLMISWIRGPAEAGHYAVSQRLFAIIPMGLALVWAPLWPIYRSALATGNQEWVRKTLRTSTLAAVGLALAACPILVVFHDPILAWFAPGHPGASGVLLMGFAAWTVLEAAGTSIATFLNSASVLRFQVYSASLMAVAAVGMKIWVLQLGYPDLLPFTLSAVYIVFFVVPLALHWKSIWRSTINRSY